MASDRLQPMPDQPQPLVVFDQRPFFEQALVHGLQSRIIAQERVTDILNDAPKGMVQIAEYFGSQYLRPNIEAARERIVSLVSLFLEESSGGDVDQAARSLRDQTFLSLSRGGSEMLKRLWAMPEDESFGILIRQSQKEFLAEWSLRSLADYRQALEQRRAYQLTISTALWFAERLGVRESSISTVAVESIIRTAMLLYLSGSMAASIPNAAEFAVILAAIRKKGLPAKGRKLVKEIFKALPEPYQAVAGRQLSRLETEDLPRIADASRPLNQLLRELEPLYFLRDFGPEDASQFDAMVSHEWQKMTGGKTDDDTLLTLFVCLATDTPPKRALTRTTARALIRKARTDAFKRPPVLAFIRSFAPYEMQDDLEALWKDFFRAAESELLDASDTTLGKALTFLKENCVVL